MNCIHINFLSDFLGGILPKIKKKFDIGKFLSLALQFFFKLSDTISKILCKDVSFRSGIRLIYRNEVQIWQITVTTTTKVTVKGIGIDIFPIINNLQIDFSLLQRIQLFQMQFDFLSWAEMQISIPQFLPKHRNKIKTTHTGTCTFRTICNGQRSKSVFQLRSKKQIAFDTAACVLRFPDFSLSASKENMIQFIAVRFHVPFAIFLAIWVTA